MNIIKSLAGFINGSVFEELKDILVAYFPPSMTEQEKAELELKIVEQINRKQLAANEMMNAAAAQLDNRIKEQEGTASDLKSLPYIGKLMLFLRGAQRPMWGYATLYLDYLWLFSIYGKLNEQQEQALIIINSLVLSFLFGERAIQNVGPTLIRLFNGEREGGKEIQKR